MVQQLFPLFLPASYFLWPPPPLPPSAAAETFTLEREYASERLDNPPDELD